MQENFNLQRQKMLIHHLASLKSDIGKLDIDKLEKVSNCLNNLERKVDKLGVDKLIPVPVDLEKISDVVEKEVFKKTVYDELVSDIKTIDTSD